MSESKIQRSMHSISGNCREWDKWIGQWYSVSDHCLRELAANYILAILEIPRKSAGKVDSVPEKKVLLNDTSGCVDDFSIC